MKLNERIKAKEWATSKYRDLQLCHAVLSVQAHCLACSTLPGHRAAMYAPLVHPLTIFPSANTSNTDKGLNNALAEGDVDNNSIDE